MKVAIMQPYLLPYLGYFQLMHATDAFVLLDDVNYINKGWINRNRILVSDRDYLFTMPLKDASQNRRINEIERSPDKHWLKKFFRTVELAYKRAPHFEAVQALLQDVFNSPEQNLSAFLRASFKHIHRYLGVAERIIPSSSLFGGKELKGQERIVHIAKAVGAEHYVNLPGGRGLYNADFFARNGLALSFLEPALPEYQQFGAPFVPGLSLIDVLMFNENDVILHWLEQGVVIG